MTRRRALSAPVLATALALSTAIGVAGQAENGYTNLRVLPTGISRAELNDVMLQNLAGLGLPRRAGRGCLYCHAGSPDVPRSEWDYASDEKPAKERARVMMAMVREINDGFLSRLTERSDPAVEVGCFTCHAGRTNPMPLDDLLLAEYASGGLDALQSTYRETRARYYEADAYDFRVGTLIDVANRLVDMGRTGDAAAVHELNVEYAAGPTSYAGLMQVRLIEALEAAGIDGMVARYHELKREQPAEGFHPLTLDPLGWALYRSDREQAGLALFELNFVEHPESFAAHESLAYALSGSGDPERGMTIARAWSEANPSHEPGRQLIRELLGRGE